MLTALMLLSGCLLVDEENLFDPDGDGYDWPDDCDSGDDQVHPGMTEVWYDGVDQDCDGNDDDADEDGYAEADDCDDTDESINPGMEEICSDGIDQDCDGGPGDCVLEGGLVEDVRDAWLSPTVSEEGFGSSVSIADANGDALPDVIVGAPNRVGGAGGVYLFEGPISVVGAGVSATSLIEGEVAGLGIQLSTGDLDGDGYDDLITTHEMGVLLGYGPLSDLDLTAPDDASDQIMISAVAMGDGVLFIGEAKESRVLVFGAGDALTPDGASAVIYGESDRDDAGAAVATGDFNGDSITDVLIGAPKKDTDNDSSGKAYMLLGPITGDIELDDAGTHPAGTEADDQLGDGVAALGDLNNDGYDDYAFGAPESSPSKSVPDSGGVFVVFGGTFNVADDAPLKIIGGEGDRVGSAMASAGDINFDGHDDLLIGAAAFDEGLGRALLYYGPISGTLGPSDADVEWKGEREEDDDEESTPRVGSVVLGGFDLDQKGVDDALIVTPGVNNDSGEISLILGVGM